MRMRWGMRLSGESESEEGFLEEVQARNRVKERKARTRRLIQEGAILEKMLPEVQSVELSELEGYLSRQLEKQD